MPTGLKGTHYLPHMPLSRFRRLWHSTTILLLPYALTLLLLFFCRHRRGDLGGNFVSVFPSLRFAIIIIIILIHLLPALTAWIAFIRSAFYSLISFGLSLLIICLRVLAGPWHQRRRLYNLGFEERLVFIIGIELHEKSLPDLDELK